jgi:hypothetical protein
MRHFGNVNLQQNQLQNAVLPLVQSFPSTPKVGQIAFINKIVYICIQDTPAPAVWIPLTREITVYTHAQESASMTWNVQHDLNTSSVNVQVYGSNNKVVIPDEIEIINPNQVQITFSDAMSGKAVVVSGHLDGNTKPTYSYTFYQTESSTTWTINHNLGYNPIVRVFIGTSEVQPASITHPSINQTIISFTTPQVGYARLI